MEKKELRIFNPRKKVLVYQKEEKKQIVKKQQERIYSGGKYKFCSLALTDGNCPNNCN